ncbi:MAG: peptide ABC transporter substrate-binding protein, partial [Gemmatimonadetes bacterium]|nr:peptide ABC transporter substrate-binding protein [Gemmatimonadota bacterium]
SACGSGADSQGSPPASTLTVAYCCGDEALNPIHDMEAKKLVFLALMDRDSLGNLVGRLATSWEPSADFREWTYRLRTDVRWQDGAPFTARDVEFTIGLMDAFWDPDYGSGAFEAVTVHDDSTITIRSGHGRRLYQTWMVFYPKHLLEDLDPERLAEWDFWTQPVGNGPYRYVGAVPGTMMEFEANPDFYAGSPSIERVVLKFSGGAAIADLLSGQVDVSSDISTADRTVAADPRFRHYFQVWGGSQQVIYWKHGHVLFSDPRVRRALTMAIDRRELLRALNIPDDVPIIDGPITPDQWNRRQLPQPLPYDPDRARALLDEAGWRVTDGSGILEKDGQPFRFTALVRTVSDEEMAGNVTAGVYVQSQLRKLGVEMTLQPLDPGVVTPRLKSGEFEAVFSWFRSYETPWLQRLGLGSGGPVGYRNPRLLELIDQASRTWVPAEEDSLYAEIAEIFRADVPVTFLHPIVGRTVAHKRLRGLSSPLRSEPVAHMDELWIEEDWEEDRGGG